MDEDEDIKSFDSYQNDTTKEKDWQQGSAINF